MSLKKIDICLFTIIALVFELLSNYFFNILESGFYLSFSFLLFLILSLRWGIIGIIPFVISGIVSVFMNQNLGTLNAILFYVISNVFAVVPILLFQILKKDKNRNFIISSPLNLFIYAFSSLIFLALGKGLACLIINGDFQAFKGYFISMIFTFILSYLIILGLSKLKNSIVADMDVYLQEGGCNNGN